MTLALAVHDLIVDIGQLVRVYDQLSNVPPEVEVLLRLIADAHSRLQQLEHMLPRADPAVFESQPFRDFRNQLLDLELFIDPDQVLPRSGPGSSYRKVISWKDRDDQQSHDFCETFKGYISSLDRHSSRLAVGLRSYVTASLLLARYWSETFAYPVPAVLLYFQPPPPMRISHRPLRSLLPKCRNRHFHLASACPRRLCSRQLFLPGLSPRRHHRCRQNCRQVQARKASIL
jgi:hypothetical protein